MDRDIRKVGAQHGVGGAVRLAEQFGLVPTGAMETEFNSADSGKETYCTHAASLAAGCVDLVDPESDLRSE
jgi:hypothetical protein